MIIWGTRGKVLNGGEFSLHCPYCGQDRFVSYGVLRYFHVYWIPLLVTSKEIGIECRHCKHHIEQKSLPKDVVEELRPGLFPRSTLLTYNLGGLVILVFIAKLLIFGAIGAVMESVTGNDPFSSAAVVTPQDNSAAVSGSAAVGDMYVVDVTKIFSEMDAGHPYAAMRFKAVRDGKAILQFGRRAYDVPDGPEGMIRSGAANADNFYDDNLFAFNIGFENELTSSGAIVSVIRH